MDASYTTYPWGWHKNYVGRWTIEIPLSLEQYGVFGHGCLLDIIASALDATGEFFFPTQIECPARNTLFDRPMPLAPGVVREALDRIWSTLSNNEDYEPGCEIHGVSYIYVRNSDGITRALVPHAMGMRLECELGKKPLARLSVFTRCDAWLERTLDGYDNTIVGSANGPVLTDNLIALETRLAGEITYMHTDFDGVSIEKYGLKNK
jgi:hypothetical protein